MKQVKLLFILFIITHLSDAQSVDQRLKVAIEKLLSNTALKHASMSLYVVNSKTNEVVFDYNSELGLVPASCQKIITSVTAYELLGNDFRYKTELGYTGKIKKGILDGNLIVRGYGDPTLGSWRYTSTKDTAVLSNWIGAIQNAGIKKINGNIILDGSFFPINPIPGGWPWEDIGNYYGAGCWGLNWNENQYDLTLKPSKNEGGYATIVGAKPELEGTTLINELITGKKEDDEVANIYISPYSKIGLVSGKIPARKKDFIISGATPNPFNQLGKVLENELKLFNVNYERITNSFESTANNIVIPEPDSIFYTYWSPTLDSITYWFLHKSINLYGEALLKTIAYTKTGEANIENGLSIVKKFWEDRGVERSALRIKDGSGLSPSNRITTNALVTILQYAHDKPWFPSFYDALPIYNGMKLKSGTIGGIKGFAGYHTSKDGVDYTVAFIVNDFDGASSEMVKKLFIVLDELK
jgi:D-alanyl-D-alanine carboxypeptidase/D-alanyl-D-alanine-endopeptidase (penicillin-binding protein 4)